VCQCTAVKKSQLQIELMSKTESKEAHGSLISHSQNFLAKRSVASLRKSEKLDRKGGTVPCVGVLKERIQEGRGLGSRSKIVVSPAAAAPAHAAPWLYVTQLINI
jgi:hypothetical protein